MEPKKHRHSTKPFIKTFMSEIKIPSQLSRQSATLESGILTCKLELSKRNSDTYKLILKKFKKIINNKNSEWEKKKNLTFSFLLTLTSHDTQFTSKLIFFASLPTCSNSYFSRFFASLPTRSNTHVQNVNCFFCSSKFYELQERS